MLVLANLPMFHIEAQSVHSTQISATPLTVNPAFTGMFDGGVRASAWYSNQWESVTVPFETNGASVDIPLYINKHGDYIASGMQFMQDRAGDGNLNNSNGLFSLSYHKFLGLTQYMKRRKGCDLGLGIQGSFGNNIIDPVGLYFGERIIPVTTLHILRSPVGYFMVNSGLCFTQSINERFNYTFGIASQNINQPKDKELESTYREYGLNRSLSSTQQITWQARERIEIKPSVFYLSRGSLNAVIAGSELKYRPKHNPDRAYHTTSFYIGGYYHTGNISSITSGIEINSFRVGFCYDFKFPNTGNTTNGSNGYELMIKYVAPSHLFFSRYRVIPSGHF